MKEYRRRVGSTFKVEAVCLTEDNVKEVAAWCEGRVVEEIDALDSSLRFPALNMPTPGGMMRVSMGKFVVRNHQGTFFLAAPAFFHGLYEEVNNGKKDEEGVRGQEGSTSIPRADGGFPSIS